MGLGGQHHTQAALPQGKVPGTHFRGGWVGIRDGMDGWAKPRPQQILIPGPSSPYCAGPPNIQFNLKSRIYYKLNIIFARFEDSTAVLPGLHVFWKYGAVRPFVRPSVWFSVSRLFEGTSDFVSKSLEFPLKA